MGHLDHDHTHDHAHEHAHSHDHDHGHSHEPLRAEDGQVSEQTVAVLRYMLDHNIHHASELSDLADQLTGEARHQMLHAVESFDQAGNGYLSAALELLDKKDRA